MVGRGGADRGRWTDDRDGGQDDLLHDPPRGPRFGPPASQPYDDSAAVPGDALDPSPTGGFGDRPLPRRRTAPTRRRRGARGSSARRLVALAAVLALVIVGVVVFVAMRGDDEPPAAFSLGAAASNASRAQRIAYELSVRLDGSVVTTASAVIEPKTGSQQITETAGGPSGTTPTEELSGFVYDAPNAAVYLDSDAFAAMGLQFERPFVRIDLDGLANGVELDTEELLARYGGSPMPIIDLLGGTAAQDLGAETLDGEAVEHFRAELSLAELLAIDPDLRSLMRIGDSARPSGSSPDESSSVESTPSTPVTGSVEAGDGSGDGTVVADVFVTEGNDLRRIVLAPSVRDAAVVTLSFTEYDGATGVSVPPEEQVIALGDAFGR